MSTVVEKNDVDIAPLFSWSKEFVVESMGKSIPVYMRVVGDADVNRSRVAALRRSADLRKKLRDGDSDERIAYIKDKEDITRDAMVSVIIVFSMRDLSEKSKDLVKLKMPKAPRTDASTEAHEKYQAEVDSYPDRFQKEHRKILEKEIDLLKKSLEELSDDELYKRYVNLTVDELCERELLKAFREWTSFLSAYKDEALTERFFTSFDEFNNLPSDVKDQFIREYSSLEMSMDTLKKLRPVMR